MNIEHENHLNDLFEKSLNLRKQTIENQCLIIEKDYESSMTLSKDFQIHLKSKLNVFHCQICSETFDKFDNLKKHLMKNHQELNQYGCVLCSKKFNRSHDLKQHLKVHLKIRSYECNICHRSFNHVSNLNRHIQTHESKKSFKCQQCSKCFAQSSSLKKHARSHQNESNIICCYCFKQLSSFDSYRKHLRSIHHLNDKKEILKHIQQEKSKPCKNNQDITIANLTADDVIFFMDEDDPHSLMNSNVDLILENKKSDKDEEETKVDEKVVIEKSKPHVCEICNQKFTRLSSLRQHSRTHNEETKLSCHLCNKKFSWNNNLRSHLRNIHKVGKTAKEAQCETCGKIFYTQWMLKQHIKRDHDLERPFSCFYCRKSFFKETDLRSHSNIHLGLKPYLCKICNRPFSHVSNLNRHLKIHQGVKEFHCHICKKEFTQNHALKQHQKRYHSTE